MRCDPNRSTTVPKDEWRWSKAQFYLCIPLEAILALADVLFWQVTALVLSSGSWHFSVYTLK